jgi:hypothetical protein
MVSPSPSDRSLSQVSAINPLMAFYGIHERKGEVQFFYFVPDTTHVSSPHSSFITRYFICTLLLKIPGFPQAEVE